MALGESYLTLAVLKARLNIVDDGDDNALTGALAAASRGVNQFCARQFNQAETASTRHYEPLTSGLLVVDDFHTTDDLVIGGDAFDADTHALEPADGIVDGEPGWPYWRIRGSGFSGRVAVTAHWGWAAVPTSVVEATFITAVELFKLKDAPFGIQGQADMGLIRIRENHRITTMLAPYRRRVVAVA
ncbi:hypothetical protein [Nocardiopsis sp. YSL2]|uniref:hypothetical protein n=1 Tax=Nocardiopsis sp. YSL2 TaxID=2939492 RepID=UPI0026F47E6C|nr:hypothetical protein [Nocardiopsis sp. YSL2]